MLSYVKGDLFQNIPKQKCILPHIVNSVGLWGSGFVIPLGHHYSEARRIYINTPKANLVLGEVQLAIVDNVTIVNMIAQKGIGSQNGPPIRYEALVKCMSWIRLYCNIKHIDRIIAPKFGSQRAGGRWEFIEILIKEIWGEFDVTIFEL